MRNLLKVAALGSLGLWLISCRGKEGPQGPPGPQGPAFSLPRDGYVRGTAIVNDNSGRRYVKEFSYEYGFSGIVERHNQDEHSISFQRYADPTSVAFFGPAASFYLIWNRANNTITSQSINLTILISGQIGGRDSLLYFSFPPSSSNVTTTTEVSNLALGANGRLTGRFLAICERGGDNLVADTIQGSFDVAVQPARSLLRTGQ
ncbi:MAG: hypothetical protein N2253_05105 [Bacteroidia bacterium]|nr:hypothetical protein [Bacteroidia bacterium]